MTAIHKAARFGTTENVYLLASLGASLLTRDDSGCSALDHYIDWLPRELSRWDTKFLAGKPLNFVQYLLDAGISAGTPGIEGESVYLRMLRKDPKAEQGITKVLASRVSQEHIADCKKLLKDERRADLAQSASWYPGRIAFAIALPLIVGGLSIGMREGVFTGNPGGNWMVPVNSIITMGTVIGT